jgi:hypothetical protein
MYFTSIGEQQQGQFPVQTFNPYIVDIQVHSTWIWPTFYQRDCLLSEIQEFEQFAAIPFNETFYVSCEVKSKIDFSGCRYHSTRYSRSNLFNYAWSKGNNFAHETKAQLIA